MTPYLSIRAAEDAALMARVYQLRFAKRALRDLDRDRPASAEMAHDVAEAAREVAEEAGTQAEFMRWAL